MEPVILIAVANENLRDAYGLLFAEQGYRVITASRILECLHKVRWLAPEVLLLDEELWGGRDGLMAISGEDVYWPSVVLLTPNGAENQDDIPLHPVVACLERPVDLGPLLDTVTEARKIYLYTRGTATPESAMQSRVGASSCLENSAPI
jgi:DNA-binding NtrC family response regulator